MAVPLKASVTMVQIVWIVLHGWISSCLLVADEIARALRMGDIGPFPVG